MRQPLGSMCRVKEEFTTRARKPMPRIAVRRVTKVMAHGLRILGRLPTNLCSSSFSISFEWTAPFAGAPRESGGVEGEWEKEEEKKEGGGFSIDPFRECDSLQLKFPDRLLRA